MQPDPPADELRRLLAEVDVPAEAAERLTFHGVWGHVHRRTTAAGLEPPAWLEAEGRGRRAWALEQHLRTLHDLQGLGALLDGAGVSWLVLKGPVLSALYPQPDLRGYTDLDLLVAPHALGAAVAALLEAGWRVVESPADLARRPPVGELHVQGPTGTSVDLHWHPFYRPDHVSRGRVDVADLLARRRDVTVGARPVPALPADAQLVHVAAHAAAGGGNRLRWLCDVGHVVAATAAEDWPAVVATARRWHLAPTVGLMLARTAAHLPVAVPAPVVAELASDRLRTLDALAGRVDPVPGSRAHGSPTAAVARASERRWTGPVTAAAARAGRAGRRRRRASAEARRADVTLLPDGPAALRRFVDAVAASTDLSTRRSRAPRR
ncbi:nucleotidyltransferase family protein [Aquipuribacter sp. SD81]|uniref:nucleotidyltransferase family protein n=1 Tax=Aquipuribacter sp. SD81 TaxID=3127703 RepID=UPI00301AAFFC